MSSKVIGLNKNPGLLQARAMTDDLDFSKLLQDAEQLTAEIDSSTDLPRVQRNLRQITEAGQLLLSGSIKDESLANAETKASIFLGAKGVDITGLAKHLEPVSLMPSTMEPDEPSPESDIEIFLKTERANKIFGIAEATSKSSVAEFIENSDKSIAQLWKLEKQRLLSLFAGDLETPDLKRVLSEKRAETSSLLGKAELTYSHEIDQYNKAVIHNMPKPNLLDRMDVAAKNSGDKNVQELWAVISSLIIGLSFDSNPSALERRSNFRCTKALIGKAKQYLEKSQYSKLQGEVWKTYGKVRVDSASALSIIKHFVDLKNFTSMVGLEIGPGDCGPVWVIIYLCLRCGKTVDAAQYVRDTVGIPDFANVLEEYAKCEPGVGLPRETESKLRVSYQSVQKSSRDPFKRLVHCILGAFDVQDDHSEVANRLDDYIWLKLSQIRVDLPETLRKSDTLLYADFQRLILETYGESHFDAFKQPFTYFQALMLTGQFEAAIEFLSRVSGLRSHAVHLAIVLHEMNLLIISDPKSPTLVRVNDDPPGLRRLNYCRLIADYSRSFQGTNTREALNYMYFLRNIKEHDGTSLFSVCVSELAMESREYSLLFGTMNSDGCRTPGILETMGLDLSPLIEYCAKESETSGRFEDAIILFDLAGKHEKASNVLIHLLSTNCSHKPIQDSSRERVQKIAVTLAERYQNYPPNASKSVLSTFYLLVDFMTFFDEFYAERIDNALSIIEKMKIIPLDKNDIERCVSNFHSYADEIRTNIPELLLATMESLYMKYVKVKSAYPSGLSSGDAGNVDLQLLLEIRNKAKTLVTYCGLLPYYMNGEIYTKVMQIEVQMR